jgi:hypothetical protein
LEYQAAIDPVRAAGLERPRFTRRPSGKALRLADFDIAEDAT